MPQKHKKIKESSGSRKKDQNESTIELTAESLHHRPESSEACYNQGIAFYIQGKLEEAAASFRQALTLKPDFVKAYYNLGITLYFQGKLAEAAACYRQALNLEPDYVEAYNNLGNALKGQGKLAEAVACYRQALNLKPDYVEAYNNLGSTLKDQGKLEEAIACYRQALTLKPDFANAHYNLGTALYFQGKLPEAVACYRQALTLKPDFTSAHNNLGSALKDQGKLEEAEASFRQALTLKPDFVDAHNNLGSALKLQEKFEEAEASYRQALILKPDSASAHNNLGNALKDQAKLEEAAACYRQAVTLKPNYLDAHSNLLLCLNFFKNQSVSQYLEEARRYGKTATDMAHAPFSDWNCSMKPERLRVGLVSGDFRTHSVGYFLENLLANINLSKIDLIAYPTYHKEDELTTRIRSSFTAWKPLLGMNDENAARLIHDDGVHVLLNLSGHTAYNRLPVFAWKPAPVLVSWLGYSASTGLAEMDYLLADPYIVPLGEEAHFTETIWRLPDSYLCFSPPRENVDVSSLPALKERLITFGCFNNPTKINESVIAVWAKVLHTIPRSQLILKAKVFSNSKFSEKTRQNFAAFGIAPERILLEGFIQNREDHLEAYNRIDIALDPFPYNGTTTSFEGLWMGVPFITIAGDRFVSHVGESIAHNAGLSDWIATDEENYVAKATAHSSNLDKLAKLRAGLRPQVLASPLFDGPRFARNFEEAMWGMWHRFQNKQ